MENTIVSTADNNIEDAVHVLSVKPLHDDCLEGKEVELVNLSEGEVSSTEEGTKLIKTDDEVDIVSSSSPESPSQTIRDGAKLQKSLTLFNAVTFILGDIIGSGIFITPTAVLKYSGSFGLALVFWVVGGLIAMAGGLVYVELGSMIKDSGAEYAYLKEAYSFGNKHPALKVTGNALGFLSVWNSSVLIRPLSAAIITQAFGVYLCQAIGGGATPPNISVKLVAISAIILIGLMNIYSLKLTATVINVFTVTKVLALIFVIVLGLWQLIAGDHRDNFTNAFEGTSNCAGDAALAFYSILFAYSGWNALGYIVEESKNAERNISLGLYIAIPIVAICYVLVNVSYYAGLSKTELLSSPATALTFGYAVIGKAGLIIIPLMVAASTFGSATFGFYAGPRTVFSAARGGNLPEVLCLLQNSSKTPIVAIIFQCLLGIFFVMFGTITQLINGIGVTEWIFFMLVFIACIIMRVTKRHYRRPFKVWIIVPILMILVSLFLIVVPIALVPEERVLSLVVIALILLGLPVYFFLGWEKLRPKLLGRLSENVAHWVGMILDSTSAREDVTPLDNQ